MEFKYKKENSFEERKKYYQMLIKNCPGKIPIICEKAPRRFFFTNNKLPEITRTKYLINENLYFSNFLSTFRKNIKLGENDSLFFLANGNHAVSASESMKDIYNKYKDKDGFLYIAYTSEEVWGS